MAWSEHDAIAAELRRLHARVQELEARTVAPLVVTEEMHVAAVKVLHRASGLDGLPQRMMDAMLAAAPTQPSQQCTCPSGDGSLRWPCPSHPPAQQRKPLTDERIEKLRQETFSTNNPYCPCDSKTMRKAVRAAESAHNIGVETK